MTDQTPNPATRGSWLPQLRSRWWTALLGLSLMLNLAIAGMFIGHRTFGPRTDRLSGASYVQLIPRSFFRSLSDERRREIMQILRESRDDLRNLRRDFEGNGAKLAEVLEKDAFSIDEVKATVTAFSTGTESLAARGGEVVVKIVSQLTPDERKQLAAAIRARDERKKRN
jgi:uncharacterized membrane protein